MGKLTTITRRAFLVSSTAIAGGVAFGTYTYKKPIDNPLRNNLPDGAATFNPFVQIDASGITLVTPRADKGQGAYSIQAYLLAEELDVDPNNVKITPGKPDLAYYNSVVADENAPGLGDVIGKLTGMQITGGSSTVPDMFVRLRHAGAVARETIKQTAAQEYGVAATEIRTKDAHVILPNGEQVSYSSLAAAAAHVTPVEEVTLRDSTDWKYLGKKVQRLDVEAKSTGTEVYGIDKHFDGMLYASVRTNPGRGGDVIRYDDSVAIKMRGIKQVIPIQGGIAVIADNTWRAIQAVNAVDIEWGRPDYPATSAEMWQVLEEHTHAKFKNIRRRDDGDVDAVLSSGDVLDVEYRVPYLAHAPLEPMNAIVKITDNTVDVWTGTQIPRYVENHVSAATGLDKSKIRIHVQVMGGSFGRRLEDTYVMQALEVAQAIKGTPVKMTWSREEDMSHDYPRPMALAKARGKVENGQVMAMQLDLTSPSLIASWMGRLDTALPGPDSTLTAGADDQPMAIKNYQVTGFKAPEMVPISSWRSVAASQNGFFHEAFLDELIHMAGADPLAERLRLCNDDTARKVLLKVGEMCTWKGTNIGEGRGRGLAFVKSFGVPVALVVDVTDTGRGIQLDNVYAAADVGRVLDPINFEAQVYGAVIFGLGHAMNCELTYENYAPEQTNFHAYQGMRLYQTPNIEVAGLENGDAIRGIGEPGLPPSAPALANAIFAATGQRLREMPFDKHVDFA